MIAFRSLFGAQTVPLLGVDVSTSSIKIVELSSAKEGVYTLERLGLEPLERGWVTDGNIEKFDEVALALSRLVKRVGVRSKNAALAIPSSAVITKKILMPADLSDMEMEEQVEAEARRYVPFPLDEVSLDYCIMGPSVTSDRDVDVFVAASRRDKVRDRQGLAEAAGLKVLVVDVDSNASRTALENVMQQMPLRKKGVGDPIVALFEVGALATTLQIVRGDEVLYEREQSFGGFQLTQQIARKYGYGVEEAENRKRSGSLSQEAQSLVVDPYTENLAQEITRALQFFFTSTPHSTVDQVFLAGGGVGLAGLSEKVAEMTSCACQVVDPFYGMQKKNHQKKTGRESNAAYLTACGLAMRRGEE